MIVVGLTGSIATGKTATASMLRQLGIPVHDADAAVHRLLAPGGAAVAQVSALFPDVNRPDGGVDRVALGAAVFGNTPALRRLEAILHPMVRASKRAFLRRAARHHAPLVVLDVPLLFETGGERECDAVIVVSAPAFLQRQRALARPGMTPAKLDAILARQVPDAVKRRRTPYVVLTGGGRRAARRQLMRHLATIKAKAAAGVDRRHATYR